MLSSNPRLRQKIKDFIRDKLAPVLGWHRLAWLIIFINGHRYLFQQWRIARKLKVSATMSTELPRKHLAFVITWFGKGIAGGAEAEAYGLVKAIQQFYPEYKVSVFTTTLKEFSTDWNQPYHQEGARVEDGVLVHRFHPTMPGRRVFHFLNGHYLMQGGTESLWQDGKRRSPLPYWAEAYYLAHMVYSPGLFKSLVEMQAEFDHLLFIPYMFTNTVLGSQIAPHKTWIIPCLHDERYAYMDIYAQAFANVRGLLCHVKSEAALARMIYPAQECVEIIGEQVDISMPLANAAQFREKFKIHDPFILYAGRQIAGKNLPLLVDYFQEFKKAHPEHEHLKLVLIGKGDLDYSRFSDIINLGFVSEEDKQGAYRAAVCLGMLSTNESFSIVMMEAWLQECPSIVSQGCAVTRDHCLDSRGGTPVGSSLEFDRALNDLLCHAEIRENQGKNGADYVRLHYAPKRVLQNLMQTLYEN
jgi:glycosyltransferase involved in cell wall biosynthesis